MSKRNLLILLLLRRLSSFKLVDEIPVELKQSNKTNKPSLGLGKALRLMHQLPSLSRRIPFKFSCLIILVDFTCVLQGTVFKNDVSGNDRTVSLLVE